MKIWLLMSRQEVGTQFRHEVWKRTFDKGASTLGVECVTLKCDGALFRYHGTDHADWLPAVGFTPGDCAINLLPEKGDTIGHLLAASLERFGIRMVNGAAARTNAGFRPSMLYCLAVAGVDVPKTVVVANTSELEHAVEFCGGVPIIVKAVRGVKGVGVAICESVRSLRSVLQILLSDQSSAILQQYIPVAGGSDYKIIATCKEVLCGFRRRAGVKEEFRANVSLGGRADLIEVPQQIGKLAVRAVQALSLVIGSVDIMDDNGALRVIEVNDLPELNLTIADREVVETEFAAYLVAHLLKAGDPTVVSEQVGPTLKNPRLSLTTDPAAVLAADRLIIIR